MPKLLSVTDAGERAGVSRAQAYILAKRGELPVVRVNGVLRVPEPAFEVWQDELTRTALASLRRNGGTDGR